MKKIYLIFVGLLIMESLYSQEIELHFPKLAGKKVTMLLKQGTMLDTIFYSTLDKQGKALSIPSLPHKDYNGFVKLNFENGSGIDFIVSSNESPTIYSKEEYPNGGTVIFSNSPENESLQQWFMSQAIRGKKTDILKEAQFLYKEDNYFYPQLVNEIQNLNQEQLRFVDSLNLSPLYASKFIQFYNYLNNDITSLLYADSAKIEKTRAFVKDSLDVDYLFTSGLWFETLNGLLVIYDNGTPYHKDFIKDMESLLKRCKYDETYIALSENLFTICETLGWNDLEEQLAHFLINHERIKNPIGKLQVLMNLYRLTKGSKIPNITQGELPKGKLLIIFYQNGCSNCDREMEILKSNYNTIRKKGYEVVSIAADIDQEEYQKSSDLFPWKNKYCDFRGFASPDFKNYGVIGTPTYYVVNEKGVIQGRYARLQDTELLK
ncbi:peroxiredoxin family protein [Myroides odoratus]|uniref:peroxiredoxin family protein n=1 Tax=Myroides odoratus TaxID=256 RepID=UPI000766134E|nr:thioredoxin-like domain-containing protein [Myroides odoratus]